MYVIIIDYRSINLEINKTINIYETRNIQVISRKSEHITDTTKKSKT